MLTLEEAKKRLILISSLEKGETINTTYSTKIEKGPLINGIYRWFYSDNRDKMIIYIVETYEIVKLFLFSIYEPYKEKENFCDLLINSFKGIINLIETYKKDVEIEKQLTNVYEQAQKTLEVYRNTYIPFLYNSINKTQGTLFLKAIHKK